MGFMESYKYLDNLCKDMNGIGITGYIKDMEKELNGDFYVAGWKNDYLLLKHYRYIRNQIAHENYADESNMCSAKDTAWLEEFYHRIMMQTDPLALCYQKTKIHFSSQSTVPKKPSTTQYAPARPKIRKTVKIPGTWVILFLIVSTFAILLCLLFQLL